ncbi:MAG: hypothetical protein AAGG75_02290 [Bacteroidota bacterium]
MRYFKYYLLAVLMLWGFSTSYAHIGPNKSGKPSSGAKPDKISYRADCAQATAQIDQEINNVRARLLTGGDVWWDGDNARYVVPKVDPSTGAEEVSSVFAGAVWLGGLDPANNLKVAAQTYGTAGGTSDFWSGPLTNIGTVEADTCAKWDRFFKVLGSEIDEHLRNYEAAIADGVPYSSDDVPENVRGWPARGNEFFFETRGFELPNTIQGLAAFFDRNGDGNYDPTEGDYPRIEIRGCDAPQFPDEMIFWIYNDAGGIHTESNADAIQMEIQVQSFAYATNDEINDMTFQRYKLINRAVESIDSTFFAMWVDPDLGCYTDDYVGCDTSRSMAYVYNEDALDGEASCNDCAGAATYCTSIPILGVDYFRGPLDENGDEIGMSSFTYYNNGALNPPPGTEDPAVGQEFYNYLSGSWRDGTPFTFGGNGYNLMSSQLIDYAFTDNPDVSGGWSMCEVALPRGDRRTVQASGPFRLDPGAVNELIIGVVWVPDMDYPCPDISPLLFADDLAQALFDNCFDITDGPDAPDVDWIELDKEVIAVFSNDQITSNNAFEAYEELDLRSPDIFPEEERKYRFEGYKLFQLVGPNVSIGELDDPDKARLVEIVDLENGVDEIFNWGPVSNPNPDPNTPSVIWVPTLQNESVRDGGLRHTFRLSEDQFATGDRRMINHRKYYFTAIAYAYNNFDDFLQQGDQLSGQRTPYLEGRRNIRTYTVIPRPIVDINLNANYGDGPIVTRLDGEGAGGNFLDVSQETREAMLNGTNNGEITYLPGEAPITVKVYNPFEILDGEYELTFFDEDITNDQLDNEVKWRLSRVGTNEEIEAETTIERFNEQIVAQYGFSVDIVQSPEPGDLTTSDNGAIGIEQEYLGEGNPWYVGVPDSEGGPFDPFNFVKTGFGEADEALDPTQSLSTIDGGSFVPYTLCDFNVSANDPQYLTPAWQNSLSGVVRSQNPLANLNNVDIVLTSDKSKWSRCVVVETANTFYTDATVGDIPPTQGNAQQFDLRGSPGVTQNDNNGDGRPDVDPSSPDGMGWFPGYAIDVETGQRVNIFFGENSTYSGITFPDEYENTPNGNDMMWNPTSQVILNTGDNSIYNFMVGGQHFIYVTKQPYDECEEIRTRLSGNNSAKRFALREITWASLPILAPGEQLTSYADGLIPNDVVIKLRVDNRYEVAEGSNVSNGYPTYRFGFQGTTATAKATEVEINEQLNAINVVPNPYYGYSAYETSQFTNTVKITNLPARCVVTIYSLDGKFIRQYTRNEIGMLQNDRNNPGITRSQISPAVEWDLENNKGIPVASGTYIIHIDAFELGERVIKWFGVARQFDPSGL